MIANQALGEAIFKKGGSIQTNQNDNILINEMK